MKKEIIVGSLMALALLVSPVGKDTIFQVNGQEITEKVQLDAPTDLQWGEVLGYGYSRYNFSWGGINLSGSFPSSEGRASWWIQLYNGDNCVAEDIWMDSFYESDDSNTIRERHGGWNFSEWINESGNYRFRVNANSRTDDPYQPSEWSEWSESISYIRPEQELGVTNIYWDEQEKGVCHFVPLENPPEYYWVKMYLLGEDGMWHYLGDNEQVLKDEFQGCTIVDVDFSDAISRRAYKNDKFCVTVQAMSSDIDVVANGEESPKSEVLNIAVNSGTIPGQNGTSGGVFDQNAEGNSDAGSNTQVQLENQIAVADSGAIVKVTKEQNINTLPNSTMQMLVKRGDVALEMEYTYEGVDYHIVIPAGEAVDNDIDWYGPLYLSAYFNVANVAFESDFSDSVEEVNLIYVVKKGDMLEKIARSYNTTVARLMAANPQIKNANYITPGQIINIR